MIHKRSKNDNYLSRVDISRYSFDRNNLFIFFLFHIKKQSLCHESYSVTKIGSAVKRDKNNCRQVIINNARDRN